MKIGRVGVVAGVVAAVVAGGINAFADGDANKTCRIRASVRSGKGNVYAFDKMTVRVDGDYAKGTRMKLTAFPNYGWTFVRWAGDIDGLDIASTTRRLPSADMTFTVDRSRDIEAVFEVDTTMRVVTYEAKKGVWLSVKVCGDEIESGWKFYKGDHVCVVATPWRNYEYSSVPVGWEKVANSDAITRTYVVGTNDLHIVAPANVVEKPVNASPH